MSNNTWNAEDYRTSFGFVTSHGESMLALLAARPGERILDLGCGTGEHVAALAAAGADVVGVDASESMLAAARERFADLAFVHADAVADSPDLGRFDAVFSNAALHWMTPQERALAFARACLGPGGRFVAEMGGHGNVEGIRAAFHQALDQCGQAAVRVQENWFPTIAQESALLEAAGFEVTQMVLFDRPTPLAPGTTAADWCEHFRSSTWHDVPAEVHPQLRAAIDELAAPTFRTPDGWWVDYRRLRFVALARGRQVSA